MRHLFQYLKSVKEGSFIHSKLFSSMEKMLHKPAPRIPFTGSDTLPYLNTRQRAMLREGIFDEIVPRPSAVETGKEWAIDSMRYEHIDKVHPAGSPVSLVISHELCVSTFRQSASVCFYKRNVSLNRTKSSRRNIVTKSPIFRTIGFKHQ